MDDAGVPDPRRPLHLWITCRMTHVFGLAHLLGEPGAAELADHGIAALGGLLHDDEHGGWWSQVDGEGRPVVDVKAAYDHAFVLLAASTSVQAGRPGGTRLLHDAVDVIEQRFWDDDAGACVEQWDGAWSALESYRGANANMHAVEAFLATADATGDATWLARAARIAERIVGLHARSHGWRIPEHYTPSWTPLPDFARDHPADPFRPFGATIGHSFEWARLLLHLDASVRRSGVAVDPGWLQPAARALFDVAVADGWSVDGAPGLVYTVDWDGAPVVRERMHWVVCEAIGAAAALHRATGDDRYLEHYDAWWDYARDFLIDDRGSWRHELDAANHPSSSVWQGRPDVYHAVQATLIPRLPLAPSLAAELRAH